MMMQQQPPTTNEYTMSKQQRLFLYMLITFCLLAVLIIVIITFQIQARLSIAAAAQQQQDDNKVLPKFFKDIKFSEYPEVLEIQPGKFKCDAKNLHKCLLDDPTTLLGCRELNVRCQNFETETKFKDSDGSEYVIPKNETPNDGYALVVRSLMENCNIWHGDPVLVTSTTADSSTIAAAEQSYLLVCQCKNPGYIGNSTILGACDTPFICNGLVDDVNQPLDKINCKCRNDQKQVRYNTLQLPVCKDKLVKDLNEESGDWTSMINWQHDRLVPASQYPSYVRDNTNINKLYDPCRSAINNVNIELAGHVEDLSDIKGSNAKSKRNACVLVGKDIPVYGIREKNFNKNSDDTFPNSGIASDSWDYFRYSYFVGGEESPTALRALVHDIDPRRKVTVVPKRRTWPFVSIRPKKYHEYTLSGVCEGVAGGQKCEIKNNFSSVDTLTYSWRFGIPKSNFRPLAFGHSDESIWKPMEWLSYQKSQGLNMRRNTSIEKLRYYGYIYGLNSSAQIERSGAVRMKSGKDFILHRNSISKDVDLGY